MNIRSAENTPMGTSCFRGHFSAPVGSGFIPCDIHSFPIDMQKLSESSPLNASFQPGADPRKQEAPGLNTSLQKTKRK